MANPEPVWYSSGPSGGPGGTEWRSPEFTADELLLGVDVRYGALIDALIVYTLNKADKSVHSYQFGGNGGALLTLFRLNRGQQVDERVVGVSGTYGQYVNSLKFVVFDTVSGAYTEYNANGTDAGLATFVYSAPPYVGVAALWGRSGGYLDAIGVDYLPFNSPDWTPA